MRRFTGRATAVRAAPAPGAIDNIFVIDLENENEATTFAPGSPATFLNGTLRGQGVFVKNHYATGHASLDNCIAQISGQAPSEETSARYITPGSVDDTGVYNHYSALRSYEDLLGITHGGTDGAGHLGFAAAPGLQPFGRDVFNASGHEWFGPNHS